MSDRLALDLARAVRAERARAGLSQSELAERMGVHRNVIWKIESTERRVNADELPELCAALGVTLAQLLARADPDDLRRLGLPVP